MRCTAIIVTYNSGASIRACLEALAGEGCEIVVVDNSSGDDTVRIVQEVAARIPLRQILNSDNRGFAAAVNQGASAAQGDVLLILNPDAIAEPGAVAALLHCMEETDAAAVGGALLEEDGQPARGFAFRRLPTLATLAYEALLINQLWPGNSVNRRYRCLDADYTRQQEVEQPAGACLPVRRAAFESVGGLDEQFFPVWFEDVDFCKRLRERSGRIFYCPEARFRHSGAHSVGQLSFRARQIFWYGNMLLYARKHFSSGEVFRLRLAIAGGMALRSLAAILGARERPLGETLAAYWNITSTIWKL
jgi:hypothetical protein